MMKTMPMLRRYDILLVTIALLSITCADVKAQVELGGGPTCAEAAPFCTSTMNNRIEGCSREGVEEAEQGPNYGCLFSQPNPAWYFIRINEAGDLRLELRQLPAQNCEIIPNSQPIDIDFIIYGPFERPGGNCSQLTAGNIVDCSYSADGVEDLLIFDAQAGDYYILLITNFSGEPGVFTLVEDPNNSSSASTDCNIVGENYARCDLDRDGSERFELDEAFRLEVLNSLGQGDGLSFFLTEDDATNNVNQITSIDVEADSTEVVYGRLIDGSGLIGVVSIGLTAYSLPVLQTDSVVQVFCSQSGALAIDLNDYRDDLITPTSDYTFEWFGDRDDAVRGQGPSQTANNVTITERATYYANITELATGCSVVATLALDLGEGIELMDTTIFVCDPGRQGRQVDLTVIEAGLGIDVDNFSISYHRSLTGANDGSLTDTIGRPSAYITRTPYDPVFVRVAARDESGCFDVLTISFESLSTEAGRPMLVDLGADRFVRADATIPLTPIYSNLEGWMPVYTWSPTQRLSCDDCPEPDFIAPSEESAIVEVIVEVMLDEICFDTDTVLFTIIPSSIGVFAPTAFSPNNDQLNDAFTLFADERFVQEIEQLSVYHRWGGLVFERTGLVPNQLEFGWDGFNNDQEAPEGTYVFHASVRVVDGSVIQLEGSFQLIR